MRDFTHTTTNLPLHFTIAYNFLLDIELTLRFIIVLEL